jgi:hypothetical protein
VLAFGSCSGRGLVAPGAQVAAYGAMKVLWDGGHIPKGAIRTFNLDHR